MMEGIADALNIGNHISEDLKGANELFGITDEMKTSGRICGFISITHYSITYTVEQTGKQQETGEGLVYALGIVNKMEKVLRRIVTDKNIRAELHDRGTFTGAFTVMNYRVHLTIHDEDYEGTTIPAEVIE